MAVNSVAYGSSGIVENNAGPKGGAETQPLGNTAALAQAGSSSQAATYESSSAPSSSGGASGSSASSHGENGPSVGGKASAAGNGGRPAVPAAIATTSPSVLNFDLAWGWYDKYYFRGVDVLKSVSPTHVDDGVVNTKFTVGYAGKMDSFTLGLGYIQALDKQVPNVAASAVPPNPVTRHENIPSKLNNERYSVEPEQRYTEYDLYLAYTRTLIPNQLQGTLGYNHYQFSNNGFWSKNGHGINFADESTIRFDYLGLAQIGVPITPSIYWAHDYDAFDGDYVELRLSGDKDLYKQGTLDVRIEPYADLSYDISYNGNNNGWNAAEVGFNLPVQLNEYFTIAANVNYTKALDPTVDTATRLATARADDGFWAGVTVDAAWGAPTSQPPPAPGDEGKQLENIVPVSDSDPSMPWELTAEGQWSQFQYDFSGRRLPAFNLSSVYTEPSTETSLGMSTSGTVPSHYLNGYVGSEISTNGGTTLNGYANFALNGFSQINGDRVYFATERKFTDTIVSQSFKTGGDNTDNVISPVVNLDREVWQDGNLSFRSGLSYAYSSSDSDSGQQLARLDSVFQTTHETGEVYYLNSFASPPQPAGLHVITNPTDYSNYYTGTLTNPTALTPQQISFAYTDQVQKVATFVQTKVDQDTNDIGAPLSLRYDLGSRFHLELTLKPELIFMDSTISTNIQARELSNKQLSKGEIQSAFNAAGSQATFFGNPGNPFGGGGALPPVPTTPPTPAPPTLASLGGGKAGNNEQTPQDPGSFIAGDTYSNNYLDLLFGVDSDLSLLYDLDARGNYFVELSGGYRWASGFSIGTRDESANLKIRSVDFGLGFGLRF